MDQKIDRAARRARGKGGAEIALVASNRELIRRIHRSIGKVLESGVAVGGGGRTIGKSGGVTGEKPHVEVYV